MKNTNQIVNSIPKATTSFDGRVVALTVNSEVELFNGEKAMKTLPFHNTFRKYFEKSNLQMNDTELDFLDKIVDKIGDLEALFGYNHSVVDTRDIIEQLNEIDEIIEELNNHNEEYIGDFTNYDNIEQYTNLILATGVSSVFINSIEQSLEALYKEDLQLEELRYIADFEYGATLWLERDFNAIDYLEDLGYFSNLQYFIKKHIDNEGLKEEITTGTYRIFGLDYITV